MQADVQHDLETEVVDLATFFFNSAVGGADGWPWERIPVWADFFVGHDRLFRFSLEQAKLDAQRRVRARAHLHFNVGFLVQNHIAYLEHIVPECVARAINQIQRLSKPDRATVEPDGTPSWALWHKKISGRNPLTREAAQAHFNKLGALLLDGHALGECQCETARQRLHALDVVRLQKVGQGVLRCEACGEPIVRVSDQRRPMWVADEIQFLASRIAPRT